MYTMDLSKHPCPPEILAKIFSCLSSREVATLRLVCSFWNDVINNLAGLHVNLNDTKEGNRRFASTVKMNSGTVELMTFTPFSLRYPNALTQLKCLYPPNHFWFIDQVLHLRNLSTLHLSDEFFYLQDLTRRYPPIMSKTGYLPNLQILKIHIPTKLFYVRDKMVCGVYPKMEEKLSERIAKNMFCILKVLRSPRLTTVEIADDFPRCITPTIQKFQWWGHVFGQFISYHQYTVKEFTLKKVFIPHSEDPFTLDLGFPLDLKFLRLHILGADLGTFHYWRALIEAQKHLQGLELHLSGSFWKRFPIQQFIKANRETLEELDLTLEYDVDSMNPEPESTFDFSTLAACDTLKILKVGPCGYLAPTINFHMIPQLLPSLTELCLTFMAISSHQLLSIVHCDNLKILRLQCLIQIMHGLISSPATCGLVKKLLCMRSLDSLAVDFITADDESRRAITQMGMKMFGKTFRGNGFFFPYDLEEETQGSTSSTNLSSRLPSTTTSETTNQISRLLDHPTSRSPQNERNDNNPEPIGMNNHRSNHDDQEEDIIVGESFPMTCPCENRKRILRRSKNCVSRYCMATMIDFCEDLIRAGKSELWSQYMDGVVSFDQIKKYIPEEPPQIVLEDECSCQQYFDEDETGVYEIGIQDYDDDEGDIILEHQMKSEPDLLMTTSTEIVGDNCLVREEQQENVASDEQMTTELYSPKAVTLSPKLETSCPVFVSDQTQYKEDRTDCQSTVDSIESMKLKDWSEKQTNRMTNEKAEQVCPMSLDVTTQYEKKEIFHSESQTELSSIMVTKGQEVAIQKELDSGIDIATQNEKDSGIDIAIQNEVIGLVDTAVQNEVMEGIDIGTQNEITVRVDMATQNEQLTMTTTTSSSQGIDIGSQNEKINLLDITTQFILHCANSTTQYENFNEDINIDDDRFNKKWQDTAVQVELNIVKDTKDVSTQQQADDEVVTTIKYCQMSTQTTTTTTRKTLGTASQTDMAVPTNLVIPCDVTELISKMIQDDESTQTDDLFIDSWLPSDTAVVVKEDLQFSATVAAATAAVKLTLTDFPSKKNMENDSIDNIMMTKYEMLNFISGDGIEENNCAQDDYNGENMEKTICPAQIRDKLVEKQIKNTIVNDLLEKVGDCLEGLTHMRERSMTIGQDIQFSEQSFIVSNDDGDNNNTNNDGTEQEGDTPMGRDDCNNNTNKALLLNSLTTTLEENVLGDNIVQVDPGKRKRMPGVRKYCVVM